jgi:hypothetical protein
MAPGPRLNRPHHMEGVLDSQANRRGYAGSIISEALESAVSVAATWR